MAGSALKVAKHNKGIHIPVGNHDTLLIEGVAVDVDLDPEATANSKKAIKPTGKTYQ